jgi:quinoprotein dehydrogenase-associated SoxYZ-like carrier
MMVALGYSAGLLKTQSSHAAGWDKATFENAEFEKVMESLGAAQAVQSHHITLRCPEQVENGSMVPLEIRSDLPNTEAIAIMIDNNPFPLAAKFDLYGGAGGHVATRIRLAQSSMVRAIVRSGGQAYSVSKLVKVTVGGCGDDDARAIEMPISADPMKIRATASGDTADIKCLMNHVMETGLRRDARTRLVIPAHHITNVTVTVAGKVVMDAQWGGGIARNPFLALSVKGANKGDPVNIKWVDNKGNSKSVDSHIG